MSSKSGAVSAALALPALSHLLRSRLQPSVQRLCYSCVRRAMGWDAGGEKKIGVSDSVSTFEAIFMLKKYGGYGVRHIVSGHNH